MLVLYCCCRYGRAAIVQLYCHYSLMSEAAANSWCTWSTIEDRVPPRVTLLLKLHWIFASSFLSKWNEAAMTSHTPHRCGTHIVRRECLSRRVSDARISTTIRNAILLRLGNNCGRLPEHGAFLIASGLVHLRSRWSPALWYSAWVCARALFYCIFRIHSSWTVPCSARRW